MRCFRLNAQDRYHGSVRELIPVLRPGYVASVCAAGVILVLSGTGGIDGKRCPGIASAQTAGELDWLVPDMFRKPGDGVDDAPSIRRALAALKRTGGTKLVFRPRSYVLDSPVVQDNQFVEWQGSGWSESRPSRLPGGNVGHGTWLIVHDWGHCPITIRGIGSAGSSIEDLAVSDGEPAPTPGAWQPVVASYMFSIQNTFGAVRFHHVMLMGIDRGIEATGSGRLSVEDLQGQVFDNMIHIDRSFDADTISGIHAWPFWSQQKNVMDYQQAHLDVVTLQRADTGFIDRIFVFGARSALHFDRSKDGVATKNTIGALHCDATKWCIWISGTDLNFQASSIDTQGQAWTVSGAAPTPLDDAAALRVDGQAVLQIGRIWDEFIGRAPVVIANGNEASNVQIGSLYADFRRSAAPASLTVFPTRAAVESVVSVAQAPMVVVRPGGAVANTNVGAQGGFKASK